MLVVFFSDTSERGCNRNQSLFHIMTISKCKPLSDLLQLLTEKETTLLTCVKNGIGKQRERPTDNA